MTAAAADAAFLASLPGWAFAFILVLCRVSAASMVMPGFGESLVPGTVRIGISLGITVLILPLVLPLMPANPADVGRGLAMIAAELFFGLTLGWLTRLLALALTMCGQFLALTIGLSNVLNQDPELGSQTAVTAQALGMAVPVLMFTTGLYIFPLAALAQSYHLVGPGQFLASDQTADAVSHASAAAFALGMRLAAPFLLLSTLTQMAIAVLARLVPQLQVHFVMMPGQILGGMVLFGLLCAYLLDGWVQAARPAFALLPGL